MKILTILLSFFEEVSLAIVSLQEFYWMRSVKTVCDTVCDIEPCHVPLSLAIADPHAKLWR